MAPKKLKPSHDASAYRSLLPPANFFGPITLNVESTATEAAKGDTATTATPLTVTVLAVDDAPVAQDDSATVRTLKTVVIDVLANDTDADHDALQAFVYAGPQHGRLCRNDDGTWTYPACRPPTVWPLRAAG
ncbi:hypothetical protein ASD68_03525 [Rhodanobacter sp. Root627]|uniref:Ig-like domain-containing protein n=1 Tax=Rhodanobacter sp. Root627 TaxID=1736572 RepID=UPI0006FA8624|nr:Ig-like domain-containing protein [Rhodanobacter sp. Root627]KRA35484.1 hypothetical protein ASD68_03525 [Rhodanobacter sp. Root627]